MFHETATLEANEEIISPTPVDHCFIMSPPGVGLLGESSEVHEYLGRTAFASCE